MPQTNAETAIHATDVPDVDILVMNPWDFGFYTVGRSISAFCVGTKVKQSFDGQRADGVDIARADWYLALLCKELRELRASSFQLRRATWLLLTKELGAEAKIVPRWLKQWNHLVSLLCFHKDLGREPLGTWVPVLTRDPPPPYWRWTWQVSRGTELCRREPWDSWGSFVTTA